MAIARVSHGVTDNGVTAATTVAFTFTPTAGSLINIWLRSPNGTGFTSIAGNGNTYLTGVSRLTAVGDIRQRYVPKAAAGSTTITATYGASVANLGMIVEEYSSPTNWMGPGVSAGGTSASADPGALVPAIDGSLLVSCCVIALPNTYTPQTGYTIGDSWTVSGGSSEFLVQTSAASTNPLITLGSSVLWSIAASMFAPAQGNLLSSQFARLARE